MMNFFGLRKTTNLSYTDPLNSEVFPEEIQSAILSYLPVEDLIKATEVSKLWNEVIGSSPEFKKSVKISLHFWDNEPSEIKNSDRHYEIINIAGFKLKSKVISCLRDKDWRYVTLNVGSVPSQKRFVEIMETFKTVKDLRILSTNIAKLSGNPTIFLPELQNLVLSDVTLDLFDVLMVNHPSLKSLSLRFVITDVKSPRSVGAALTQFLNLNENLKDLEINHVVTNDFFKNPQEFSNLKLKNVTIGLDSTSDTVRDNIVKFLSSQGKSIENLKFIFHQKFVKQESYEWRYWEVAKVPNDPRGDDDNIIYQIWDSMTALTSINLRFLKNSLESIEDLDFIRKLKRNVNVTSLNIQFMDVTVPNSVLINLMKLAPNLKSIYVTKLSSEVTRFAAINLKALRCIKCFTFAGDCIPEYAQLKESRADVNKLITISDRCAFG